MSVYEESDIDIACSQDNRSLSELEEDFDHTIGLSPRSSTSSYGNGDDLTDRSTTPTPETQGRFEGQGHCVKFRFTKDYILHDHKDKMSASTTPDKHSSHVPLVNGTHSPNGTHFPDEHSPHVPIVNSTHSPNRNHFSDEHSPHVPFVNGTRSTDEHSPHVPFVNGTRSPDKHSPHMSLVNGTHSPNGTHFPDERSPHVPIVKSPDDGLRKMLTVDTSSVHNSKRLDRRSVQGMTDYDECDGDDEDEDDEDERYDDDNVDMASQLAQLQKIVGEMKSGFVTAMKALAQIQDGDQKLQDTISSNKEEYEKQLADVLTMVLTLKSEFDGVLNDLHAATDNQRTMRHHIESLQYERDILLEELEKAGAISNQLREKYHSGSERPDELYHSKSSSNLCGLLERARLSFQANHGGTTGSQNSSHVTSDSGVTSGPAVDLSDDVTSAAVMSPMVQSYIEALEQQQSLTEEETANVDSQDESDSSITAAANKSLDLSRSLGDACGGHDLDLDLSDTEKDKEGERVKDNVESSSGTSSTGESSNRQAEDDTGPFKRPLTPPNKLAPHERNAKEVQRGRVAKELVETERTYCSNLWTLIDHFASRLRDNGLLSNKDINQMFPPCLARIYEYHCAFLQKLEDRLGNGKWQCVIGDVVSRFIESSECDLLTQYQNYMNEFPTALHCIRKTCRNSSKFRKFLREAQHHPSCAGLDVGAFMLTPVQRVPRYVLLLKQLVKHTDREHPDHYFLDSSLHRLGNFLNQLNDSIETSTKLVQQEEAPKIRKKTRFPSFRRSNTADALETSSLGGFDTNLDSSALANSLDGRFLVSSPKHGRPLHGYPNVMLSSAQSLQAIPVAISQNDVVIDADTAYLVQDSTGRLIPVKQKKVKRASKAGFSLSSSFHGGARPQFDLGESPRGSPQSLRAFQHQQQQRPHSICMSNLPENFNPYDSISTSTPSAGRSKHYLHNTGDVTAATSQLEHEMTSQLDRTMMPPPPPVTYTPRPHASHVQTNGSLSYHQNLRRVQNEYHAPYSYDSESDPDMLPAYQNRHGNGVESAFTQYNNYGNVSKSSHPPSAYQFSEDLRHEHPGAYNNHLKSRSVVELKDTRCSFKSNSSVDFRGTAPEMDSVSQQRINAALAQSLSMRATASNSPNISNQSPISTHSQTGGQNIRPIPRQCSFDFKPKIGNIDRPVSKLVSKRSSLKRHESPVTSPLRSSSSLSSDVWQHERWNNSSAFSPNQSDISTTDVSGVDISISGSKRKDFKKQQKEREKKLSAQSMGDLGKKARPSLRQSLKNIFFRKNEENEGNELRQPVIEEENSKVCGSTGNLLDSSTRNSMTSLQSAPNRNSSFHDDDDSLVIANISQNGHALSLPLDDSDPCSAV